MRSPLVTGACVASGKSLARTLVDGDLLAGAAAVLELGAGTGAVTEEILRRMGVESRLLSIEVNAGLAGVAAQRCPGADVFVMDARDCQSLVNSQGFDTCDVVISSIPWATMNSGMQRSLLDAIGSVLRSGGVFTTFAYIHSRCLPGARSFNRELKGRFGSVGMSPVVWRNMPPAVVYKVVAE